MMAFRATPWPLEEIIIMGLSRTGSDTTKAPAFHHVREGQSLQRTEASGHAGAPQSQEEREQCENS